MVKIVVLDGYAADPGDISWEPISSQGELKVYDRTPYIDEEIINRIGDAEVVFTNKVPINKVVIDACPNMKLVSVLATGFNIVDTAYAKEKGVLVANVPAYSTMSVVQMTFALLLAATNHTAEHSAACHGGDWQNCPDFAFWKYPISEQAGKKFGIIGYGSIGKAVANVATAFGMEVYGSRAHGEIEESEHIHNASQDYIFENCDVISLHCPLTDSTKNLVNADAISKMKNDVIIINTARGPVVNEADIAQALKDKKIGYYCADVVSKEPILAENPLLGAPNCILSPHIAWASTEARIRLMNISAENLKAYIEGHPQNIVNK